MAKKDNGAVTLDKVQHMIDAALVKHDLEHGHISSEDAAARLAALEAESDE